MIWHQAVYINRRSFNATPVILCVITNVMIKSILTAFEMLAPGYTGSLSEDMVSISDLKLYAAVSDSL